MSFKNLVAGNATGTEDIIFLPSTIFPAYWVKWLSLQVYIDKKQALYVNNVFALQSSAWVWKQAAASDFVHNDPW